MYFFENQNPTPQIEIENYVNKRQADSLVSEPQQQGLAQGKTCTDFVQHAMKKSKASESQSDGSPRGENLPKEPAMEEPMDDTTTADGDNKEIEDKTAKAGEKTEENPRKNLLVLELNGCLRTQLIATKWIRQKSLKEKKLEGRQCLRYLLVKIFSNFALKSLKLVSGPREPSKTLLISLILIFFLYIN